MKRGHVICYILVTALVSAGLISAQERERKRGTNLRSQINADSTQYVFVYDISNNAPVKKQVIQVPNAYQEIVFDPGGKTFYVFNRRRFPSQNRFHRRP